MASVTSETKDVAELGAVLALYGGKALAAGVYASVTCYAGVSHDAFQGCRC